MNSFNVDDLKENTYFTSDVLLDKTFLLLNNSLPVTESLLSALKDWEFKQVFSDGNIGSGMVQAVSFNSSSTSVSNNISTANISFDVENVDLGDLGIDMPSSPVSESVKKALGVENSNTKKTEVSVVENEQKRMSMVCNVYNEYLNYINRVYTKYSTHKELDLEELSNKIKDLCVFIKDNRRYVLQVEPELFASDRNFIISHSMRSTVLAITIGLQLRMPLSKLIELGVACVLHEIGMIRLPPQLYLSQKQLSSSEKNQLNTHPIISYTILKGFDAPLSICLGVLEHHEKENGMGYPRHIRGDKISLYAKIIAVVCSYEAITAPRSYKTASDSFEAMVEMLKNNGQQYDGTVIKALLYSLSLYPIGSYVYLSNGKIGRVVDVNPNNPKNPVVQVVSSENKSKEPETIETSETGIRVMRVLNQQEKESLLQHLE